ncbi:hypothetical protein RRG08_021600 [Elysia crispata]|uniref:Uncharacterized protein n=1 Tax=Elysia crispata TaxID=231223 RepID=A0AAE0XDP6_9GAST|nr:hypothetical protein RRG08_021600 [Elysia crispata]
MKPHILTGYSQISMRTGDLSFVNLTLYRLSQVAPLSIDRSLSSQVFPHTSCIQFSRRTLSSIICWSPFLITLTERLETWGNPGEALECTFIICDLHSLDLFRI